MPTAIPATECAQALRVREEELVLRLQRCSAAHAPHQPNPPLGRETDDVRAQLAKVRRDLQLLAPR
jgi:hypothetical protein